MNEFADSLAILDRKLKGGPPLPEPPLGLHGSIMAAVRGSTLQSAAPLRTSTWRRLAAPAVFCLLLLALWSGIHFLASRFAPSPFHDPAVAKINQQMVALPTTMLSPLSQEWQRLNRDLENTADFLIASVP